MSSPSTHSGSFSTDRSSQSSLDTAWTSEPNYIVEAPNMRFNATPDAPAEDQPVIGIIGMGEMGKMYARTLSAAGWAKWVLLLICGIITDLS